MEVRVPSSIGYGSHQFNQESSSVKISSSPIDGSVVPDRTNEHGHRNTVLSLDQTLDQDRQHDDKDDGADPDPDPPQDTRETIAEAPNSKTTSSQARLQLQAVSTAISNISVRYRECLKNHAANMGGHVLDGCGEFMPNGEDETPEALKCAACDCHRSFHRKEVDGETQIQTGTNHYSPYHPGRINNSSSHHTSIHPRPPPSLPAAPSQQNHQHKFSQIFSTNASTGTHLAPMMMAFGGNGGVPAESSSEDLNMYHSNNAGTQTAMNPTHSTSRKRFRTKFTSEQKGKMHEFAEKLGWTIQKQDEQELQQFCAEVGVKRQVFKVWMHNNKQAMKKKQT